MPLHNEALTMVPTCKRMYIHCVYSFALVLMHHILLDALSMFSYSHLLADMHYISFMDSFCFL